MGWLFGAPVQEIFRGCIRVVIVSLAYVTFGSGKPSQLCASFTEYGWLGLDRSKSICFTYSENSLSWWGAKSVCAKQDMLLARPKTKVISEFLRSSIPLQSYDPGHFWIDAIDRQGEGWAWSDGDDMKYNDFTTMDVVLDSVWSFFSKADYCALLGLTKWEQKSCGYSAPFVCQTDGNTSVTDWIYGAMPYQTKDSGIVMQICTSFDNNGVLTGDPFGKDCFIYIEQMTTGLDADRICRSEDMFLVSVDTLVLNSFLFLIKKNTMTDFWIADSSKYSWENDKYGCTIRGDPDTRRRQLCKITKSVSNPIEVKSNLVLDDITTDISRIFESRPVCVLYSSSSYWTSKDCGYLAPFVCQMTRDISMTSPESDQTKEESRLTATKNQSATTAIPGQNNQQKARKPQSATPVIPRRNHRQRIFKVKITVEGRLNPRLTIKGIGNTRTTDLLRCVRLCTAKHRCVLINFCQNGGHCVLYDNFDISLNSGVTSEKGCSVYMDMAEYNKV